MSGNTPWMTAFLLAVFIFYFPPSDTFQLDKQIPGEQRHFGGFYFTGNSKWRVLNNLDFICCYACGLSVQPQGSPGNPPRLPPETRREKCATEWKSQHSQLSPITTESLYSTLGKTGSQALIMRERVRQKVPFGQHMREKTKQKTSHLFTPLEELGTSCAFYPFHVVLILSD